MASSLLGLQENVAYLLGGCGGDGKGHFMRRRHAADNQFITDAQSCKGSTVSTDEEPEPSDGRKLAQGHTPHLGVPYGLLAGCPNSTLRATGQPAFFIHDLQPRCPLQAQVHMSHHLHDTTRWFKDKVRSANFQPGWSRMCVLTQQCPGVWGLGFILSCVCVGGWGGGRIAAAVLTDDSLPRLRALLGFTSSAPKIRRPGYPLLDEDQRPNAASQLQPGRHRATLQIRNLAETRRLPALTLSSLPA